MFILACLKNQVKNHSKIDNSVNNQKSKISKTGFSTAWKENRDNIIDIMIQTRLFLLLNIMIKMVCIRVSNLSLFFWSGDNLVNFRDIKNTFGYQNMMPASTHQ